MALSAPKRCWISVSVRSGCCLISSISQVAWSVSLDRVSPPQGFAAALPVSRTRRVQRIALLMLTPKIRAAPLAEKISVNGRLQTWPPAAARIHGRRAGEGPLSPCVTTKCAFSAVFRGQRPSVGPPGGPPSAQRPAVWALSGGAESRGCLTGQPWRRGSETGTHLGDPKRGRGDAPSFGF